MNTNFVTPIATILIVDDLAFNLQILMSILEPEGYNIKPVLNGILALKSIKISPPDLILLDINMPVMNGYEVCQSLKSDAQTQDIPVIFVSSFEEDQYKIKAYEVGGVDYINKPVLDIEVIKRVESQIKIKMLEKQLALVAEKIGNQEPFMPDY